MNSNLKWVNNIVERYMGSNLHNYNEIPTHVYYYSPFTNDKWQKGYEKRIFPADTNQILHREKGLLSREVGFIGQRIARHSIVNIFDVGETMGDSSLPMIYELMESGKLGKYMPVTPSSIVNESAIKTLKRFSLGAGIKNFAYDSVVADVEVSPFKPQMLDAISDLDMNFGVNLFLVMNSRLGNSLNPKQFLHNIYQTMEEGDYLAILQGLYRSGTEDMLVADYKNLYTDPESLIVSSDLVELLTPQIPIKVYFDDSQGVKAIKMSAIINKPTNISNIEFAENQEITLFRSTRFEEFNLRTICKEVGFHLVDIAYDDNMDNGLLFLEK